MIKTMLFGMGAAGNKAAIMASELGHIDLDNVILFNSTTTDIPAGYKGQVFELPGNAGGTGKDRNISKKQARLVIDKQVINFEKLLHLDNKENKVKQVVFVTSTDGGSGSGSTVEFANYIANDLKVPVMVCAFIGRAKDIRGQRNTIEFFKELSNKITIQIIMNESFSSGSSDTNDSKIETEANAEFCNRLAVLLGSKIDDNVEQNLDQRELYKIRTTPGYMIITSKVFNQKIKNNEQVKKEAVEMFDNLKSPDPDARDMTRVGLVYSSEKEESSYMDILPVVKDKFGLAYEVFTHRQYKPSTDRFIYVIMAGLTMPTETIKRVYDQYIDQSQSINKRDDDFFKSVKEMDLANDSDFDVDSDWDDLEF